jgi:hypothetical protein
MVHPQHQDVQVALNVVTLLFQRTFFLLKYRYFIILQFFNTDYSLAAMFHQLSSPIIPTFPLSFSFSDFILAKNNVWTRSIKIL